MLKGIVLGRRSARWAPRSRARFRAGGGSLTARAAPTNWDEKVRPGTHTRDRVRPDHRPGAQGRPQFRGRPEPCRAGSPDRAVAGQQVPAPEVTEFAVAGRRGFDRRGPARWVLSHQLRYPGMIAGFLGGSVIMVVLNSTIPGLVGWAFDAVTSGAADQSRTLAVITAALLVVVLARSGVDLLARLCTEVLANRIQRDARDE